MQATAIFVLAFAALPSVLAFCCDGPQCADGTSGTPCCGYKKCNIFCCACGGKKCRGGKRELLSSFEQRDPSVEAFAQADVAGNGNLTLDQYLTYMGVQGDSGLWTQYFKDHDKNGDGVITEDEVHM